MAFDFATPINSTIFFMSQKLELPLLPLTSYLNCCFCAMNFVHLLYICTHMYICMIASIYM